MTKDGRLSLVNDIRLFVGDCSKQSSYLQGQEEAVAFARRIGWYLNGEKFSLGVFPALYLLFTPAIEVGSVQVMDDRGEWWHRYTHIGVAPDFPNVPDALEIVMRGLVAALLAMRPDQAEAIKRADAIVREHGEELRFLLKRRETKKLIVEITFNIRAWPQPSYLFISRTEKATGVYSEAEPIPLGTYLEGFDLVGSLRAQDATNFEEKPSRPVMSKQVRRRR